jgi:hypothetical protein
VSGRDRALEALAPVLFLAAALAGVLERAVRRLRGLA